MAFMDIHLDHIYHNLIYAKQLCSACLTELAVVTKCCRSDLTIMKHLMEWGVTTVAESHPANFKSPQFDSLVKICLSTSVSSLKQDSFCDYIFTTELDIIKHLSELSHGHTCRIVIPIELGDLREGVPPNELISFIKKALGFHRIKIAGFSANYGCFSEFEPTNHALDDFIKCVNHVKDELHFFPEILSIGGSSLWSIIESGSLPNEINQVRLGEAIFLGTDPAFHQPIKQLKRNTCVINAEIIEIKDKYLSHNHVSYCGKIHNNGRNFRKRAVLDIGYTAAPYSGLTPIHKGIEIVGSTQDHMVVDITNAENRYGVGDSIAFLMNYEALACAMINPYINKHYLTENYQV